MPAVIYKCSWIQRRQMKDCDRRKVREYVRLVRAKSWHAVAPRGNYTICGSELGNIVASTVEKPAVLCARCKRKLIRS